MNESEQNFIDIESLVAGLDKHGPSSKLKACLEQLEAIRSDDVANADKISIKEKLLRKISDIIVTSSRILTKNEKSFWFSYFKSSVENGF